MRRPSPQLSPDARSLIDRERLISVLPAAARARALARARAALVAGATRQPIPSEAPPAIRWAAAARLICLATVAAAAAAYEVGLRTGPAAPTVVAALLAEPSHQSSARLPPMVNLPTASPPARTPVVANAAPARQELRILQQARAEVAGGNFAAALQLLAEQARRSKTGQLAEEREALRVRALAGLGRHDDARRVAADFEARFPRSPLLPAVATMADSAHQPQRSPLSSSGFDLRAPPAAGPARERRESRSTTDHRTSEHCRTLP
jgi:hypothetical protein